MAGYLNFQTGQVLTAAQVNGFLMEQSVMAFADAGARDTALGTAVAGGNALREGMLAYLNDTDDLLKYDGTAWSVVGASAVKNVYYVDSTTVQVLSSVASGTYNDVTGLSITVTPESADSKFFCYSQIAAALNATSRFFIGTKILRDATDIVGLNNLGWEESNTFALAEFSVRASDSPATTSSITYKVQVAPEGGGTPTIYVNRNPSQTTSRYRSFLLVVEYE